MASGWGVGGGAGVGVVVPGPGVGRGRLGVTGCGRSPLLAGGCWVLVLWVCVCCVCGAGGACALVCGVRLWGSCRWRLWWCVLCACAGVCAVCWWCFWVPVLAFLGLVWGLCVGVGAVCRGPSPVPAVWFPAPLAGVCWWCVPPPPPLHALLPLSLFRVAWGGVPLVPCPGFPGCSGWGGVLVVGSGPFPSCFPFRGPMLALLVRV